MDFDFHIFKVQIELAPGLGFFRWLAWKNFCRGARRVLYGLSYRHIVRPAKVFFAILRLSGAPMTMSSDNFQQISYSLLLALSCSSFVQVSRPRVRRDSADNPDGPVQHLPSAKHHVSVLPFEYSNFEHSFRQNTISMDSRMFMNPTKWRIRFSISCTAYKAHAFRKVTTIELLS